MPGDLQSQVQKLQNHILHLTSKWRTPLPEAIKDAFLATPRHWFVKEIFRGDEVIKVTPDNLPHFLPAIYADGPLTLKEDPDQRVFSTMSQPTLVLLMLRLLELAPGQRVFEVGAASGWNAAMMGRLVGPSGRVFSVEIIPEIAEMARETIAAHGIRDVEIITGDAGEGYAPGAPYDRAIFTAGAYDLPAVFFEQVRFGGLLLFILRLEGGGDQLMLLERKEDHFALLRSLPCSFVPFVGKHADTSLDPVELKSFSGWPELGEKEVDRRSFWWGLIEGIPPSMAMGVRSFLSVTEPNYVVFRDNAGSGSQTREQVFGLYRPEEKSLVIARRGALLSYGNTSARDHLLKRLHDWIDHGMPSLATMKLRIYPKDAIVPQAANQWIVRRANSKLVWTL